MPNGNNTLEETLASFRPFFLDSGMPRAPADVLRIQSGILRARLEGTLQPHRREAWNQTVRNAIAARWDADDAHLWGQLLV